MRTEDQIRARTEFLTLHLRRGASEEQESALHARREELWWVLGLVAPPEDPQPSAEYYAEMQEVFHTIMKYLFGLLPGNRNEALLEQLAQDHNYTLKRVGGFR